MFSLFCISAPLPFSFSFFSFFRFCKDIKTNQELLKKKVASKTIQPRDVKSNNSKKRLLEIWHFCDENFNRTGRYCKFADECLQWKLWVACDQQYRWSHCRGRCWMCLVLRQGQREQMPLSFHRLTSHRSTPSSSTLSCLFNGKVSSKGEWVRFVCFCTHFSLFA